MTSDAALDRIDQELVRLLARRQVHAERLARAHHTDLVGGDTVMLQAQAAMLGLDADVFDQVWASIHTAYTRHATGSLTNR